MSDRPLVSVVTGTWQRHDLLLGLVENLRAQTYRPIEHVIVSDGPDPALRSTLEAQNGLAEATAPIIFQELGFQSSEFFSMSVAAAPFLVAQLMAHGPLQMWASDDERFAPDHIEALVDLLYERDVDWVAPLVRCHAPDDPDGGAAVGQTVPRSGHVTHALYRRELLDYRTFRLHIGSGTDWDQADAWTQAGASYALLPRVTMTHQIDKLGEGEGFRPIGQPLRGRGGVGVYLGPRWKGYALDRHGRIDMDHPRGIAAWRPEP